MPYDRFKHHRRSIRLPTYDYAQPGAYFVTMVARGRECLFGDIADGAVRLNDAGAMVESMWSALPGRFPRVRLDVFVVMPNHLHGIIVMTDDDANRCADSGGDEGMSGYERGDHEDRPYDTPTDATCAGRGEPRVRPYAHPTGTRPRSLGRIIQAFKSLTTVAYIAGVRSNGWRPFDGRLWRRNYHEHIIRDEDELRAMRHYVAFNPARWQYDRENPNNTR